MAFEPLHLSSSKYVTEHFVTGSKDSLVNVWQMSHASVSFKDPEDENISKKDVFKITKAHKVVSLAHTAPVEAIKWSGEGFIYSAGRDRVIKIWSGKRGEMGKLLRTLTGHGHRINCLALNCDYVTRTGPFTMKNNVSSREKALENYQNFNGIIIE